MKKRKNKKRSFISFLGPAHPYVHLRVSFFLCLKEGVEVEMEETDFRDDEEAGSQQPRDLPDTVQSTLSTEPKVTPSHNILCVHHINITQSAEGEQSSGQGSAVLASSPSGFGLGSFSAALLKRTKRTASIEQT